MKYKKSKNFTIIIVTYKSKHIVAKTLENIINQNVRIIIIDNGSNDNIEQFLLEKYPNSGLELILLDNNCGFSRANNLALAKVTTKYAFLLNPDTVISLSAIDDLINIADKDENIALVYSDYYLIDSNLIASSRCFFSETIFFSNSSFC